MLDRLREKVAADRLPVSVGDMATTRVPGEFALVYLVFNTISNLVTQAEQVRCFRNAARHLAPGGRFASEPGYLGLDTYDVLDQQVVSHHFRFGRGREATHAISPHRFIWPAELDLMGQLAGLALEARYADWDRSPFTAESGSHVSVYRLSS